MPIGYLEDCRSHATITKDGEWCFEPKRYSELAAKYRKYARSQSDPYRDRISGCCDRADQY